MSADFRLGASLRHGGRRLAAKCIAVIAVLISLASCCSLKALDEREFVIRVVDVRDESPLSTAIVLSGEYISRSNKVLARADGDGSCAWTVPRVTTRLGDMTIGVATPEFWVTCPGYVPRYFRSPNAVSDNEPKGGIRPLILPMTPATPLRVHVVREDCSPVVGEPVLLVGYSDGVPIQCELETDDQGSLLWTNAPTGRAYVIMGVEKVASSPVFVEIEGEDREPIITIPANWRGVAGKTESQLTFLRKSANGWVLPSSWRADGQPYLSESLSSFPDLQIDQLIVSDRGPRKPLELLGVRGVKHDILIRGDFTRLAHMDDTKERLDD